jgi:DNA polymerase I-like protein with 3'-5' exonuclease and polymerase domains
MSLAKLKEKVASQKKKALPKREEPKRVIAPSRTTTPTKLSPQAKARIAQAESTAEVQQILNVELPGRGYHAVGKNDLPKLRTIAQEIRKKKIISFDYETNGDPEDDTQDPQDHEIVGVSVAWEIGQAFYFPMNHTSYGANWETDFIMQEFLKPLLEDPEILVIAHNIKAEHQWSLLHGIDMFPKTLTRKIICTLVMVKQLALPETVGAEGETEVGLKPATKALLADKDGWVHGLIHVDNIKTFKQTVGKHEWEEPIPGEYYKSGAKKGLPKTKKQSRYRTFNELPVDKHSVDYACSDSDWGLGVYLKCYPLLVAEGLDDVYFELNVPFMMTLGEIELAGWRVNPDKLRDMERVAFRALYGRETMTEEQIEAGDWEDDCIEQKLYEALREVTKDHAGVDDHGNVIVPAGVYGMGQWRGDPVALEIKTPKPFSWGSPQHKSWLFFHVLQVDTRGVERSKTTGIPGTGKDNMELIIDSYEGDSAFMKVLKERSKYTKILSTYVNGMLPFCRKDTNKLHTQLNLVSTWRLSSKKPNLQNIPRPDNDPMGIRGVFEAPSYDLTADYTQQNIFTRPNIMIITHKLSGETIFIGCDYSQIELKVLAWFAQEKNMIQAFIDNIDLHSLVAREVFKLQCTIDEVKSKFKPYRYRAKKVNFGIVYGMTEFGLSKDRQMGMTKDEAKVFINNYMATYPGIRGYADSQISFAREYGYVETLFGNRRPIPDINHPKEFIRKSAENKAMNTPIQGSASDIIRRAMVEIKKRSIKEAPYIKQVMQIHDEIQAECPIEYASEGARWIKEVMEAPLEGFTEILPIIAEPAVGKIWQHALDVSWDADGTAWVKPKKEKKEATDVTYDDIAYMIPLFKKANIEVR